MITGIGKKNGMKEERSFCLSSVKAIFAYLFTLLYFVPVSKFQYLLCVLHTNEVNAARKVVISVQPGTVSTAQTILRNTYDETQEKGYHDILGAFDSCESTNDLHGD